MLFWYMLFFTCDLPCVKITFIQFKILLFIYRYVLLWFSEGVGAASVLSPSTQLRVIVSSAAKETALYLYIAMPRNRKEAPERATRSPVSVYIASGIIETRITLELLCVGAPLFFDSSRMRARWCRKFLLFPLTDKITRLEHPERDSRRELSLRFPYNFSVTSSSLERGRFQRIVKKKTKSESVQTWKLSSSITRQKAFNSRSGIRRCEEEWEWRR